MNPPSTKQSPLLLESIRIVDGEAPLLARHQARVDRSRKTYYGKGPSFKLDKILGELDLPTQGCHKLRLEYGAELVSSEIINYKPRTINSLRVVHGNHLRYGRKYADRSGINALFQRRESCDDIIILQRNHLTDASYANLALYDGTHWYTPAWPLLRGTRRAELIDRGTIRPAVIRLRDLHHFEQIRLINSMMDWEQSPTVPVENVVQ